MTVANYHNSTKGAKLIMESINFNEYTENERYDIISSFLKKSQSDVDDASTNAERFFEFYFQKFYKIPVYIQNDIVYCQQALKSHLQVHQLVVQVFAQQADADPVQKDKFLRELEDQLYEINAECNYLTLRMREDIKKFCAVFNDYKVKCNSDLIAKIVTRELTNHVSNTSLKVAPITVLLRETENSLVERFFTVCQDDSNVTANIASISTPIVIDTLNISDDDEELQLKMKSDQQTATNQTRFSKFNELHPRVKSDQHKTNLQLTRLTSKRERHCTIPCDPAVIKQPTSITSAAINNASGAIKEKFKNTDQVRASRLNFLQVLKRTRTERLKRVAKPAMKVTSKLQTVYDVQKKSSISAKEGQQNTKNFVNEKLAFLHMFELCTYDECKRMLTARHQLKRRSFNKLNRPSNDSN